MNITAEAIIPKIFASNWYGNSIASMTVRVTVVAPPISIAQNAAVLLLRFQYSAPITGTNKPETMKA